MKFYCFPCKGFSLDFGLDTLLVFKIIVRLKFQKWNPALAGRSALKFLSRTIPGSGG